MQVLELLEVALEVLKFKTGSFASLYLKTMMIQSQRPLSPQGRPTDGQPRRISKNESKIDHPAVNLIRVMLVNPQKTFIGCAKHRDFW
jgi:hypothetical protein